MLFCIIQVKVEYFFYYCHQHVNLRIAYTTWLSVLLISVWKYKLICNSGKVFSIFAINVSISVNVQLKAEKEKFKGRFNRINLRLLKLLKSPPRLRGFFSLGDYSTLKAWKINTVRPQKNIRRKHFVSTKKTNLILRNFKFSTAFEIKRRKY